MKVFFINTVCGVGSTGRIVTSLMDRLRTRGHWGRVAFGYGEANHVKDGESFKVVSTGAYYAHNLLSRITDREGLFSSIQTRKLIARIKADDPDLIHLHNLHGHYLNYEILFRFLKKSGKPIVWTFHDCWPLTGHCAHYAAAGCGKWKTQCEKCSQLRQYPQCYGPGNVKNNYIRKKAAFTSPDQLTIVTPSRWMAEQVKESFLKHYPVRVIHNGVDLSVFSPRESDFRKKYQCEDKIILLGVAFDWGYKKGLDVFLELEKRLDDRFRIVLVGTNEKIDRELPPGIISIHRTQDQQELAQIYSAADLFVNPTREEALGLVNVEALACGTPVVTFRSGGSPECIDHNCGSVVDCDDIDALQREIERIAVHHPFTKEACLLRAKNFDARERFEDYLRLYGDILNVRI